MKSTEDPPSHSESSRQTDSWAVHRYKGTPGSIYNFNLRISSDCVPLSPLCPSHSLSHPHLLPHLACLSARLLPPLLRLEGLCLCLRQLAPQPCKVRLQPRHTLAGLLGSGAGKGELLFKGPAGKWNEMRWDFPLQDQQPEVLEEGEQQQRATRARASRQPVSDLYHC